MIQKRGCGNRNAFNLVLTLFIISVLASSVLSLTIGGQSGGYYSGLIDEFSLFNRALSQSEILNHYKAGILSLNISVRSCSSPDCSDGTWSTAYTSPPAYITVENNRYFQYEAYFATENSFFTPELKNVTFNYQRTPILNTSYFSGTDTTSLGSYLEFTNISNLTLHNGEARINWQDGLDIEGYDFDAGVKLEEGFASLNALILPALNTSANVTIYNVNCSEFNLYYANDFYTSLNQITSLGTKVADETNLNSDCLDATICKNVTCDSTTLSFNAEHFDSFGVTNNSAISVSLTAPADSYGSINNQVTFNCSAENTGRNLSLIVLFGNFSGSFVANETKSVTGQSNSSSFTLTLPDGEFVWNCKAINEHGTSNFSSSNRTLGVDSRTVTWNSVDVSSLTHNMDVTEEANDLNGVAVDLNYYFSASSGQANYFATSSDGVTVTFSYGVLKVTPNPGFYGVANVTINATLGYTSALSNTFEISVYNATTTQSGPIIDTSYFTAPATTNTSNTSLWNYSRPTIGTSYARSYSSFVLANTNNQLKFNNAKISGGVVINSTNVKSEYGFVAVNSSDLTELNNTQTDVIMTGLTFTRTPTIYYNPTILNRGLTQKPGTLDCLDAGTCSDISYNVSTGTLTFKTNSFSAYEAGINASLGVWDETDVDEIYANMTKYINDSVTFYANYTNTSNDSISDGECYISFEGAENNSMTYNATISLYNYNKTFETNGLMNYTVTCNHTDYVTIELEDNATINLNNLPSSPALYSPEDEATLTQRTPSLTWNNSVDLDENVVTYHVILDNDSDFSSPIVNVTGITETENVTTYSVSSELEVDALYYWKVRGNDGLAYGEWSNTSNFTLESYISIVLINDQVNFSTLSLGQSINTTQNSPLPFLIQNNGNMLVNITVTATEIFDRALFPSSAFQFKIDLNESDAFNYLSSTTSFTNVTNVSSNVDIFDLDWRDSKDSAEIDILLNVPTDETPGEKNSTFTFTTT